MSPHCMRARALSAASAAAAFALVAGPAAVAAATAPSPVPADAGMIGLPCMANADNQFVMRVSYTAPSVTGLYTIDGCEGFAPTLMIERGVEYEFVQEDRSNYYHPVGFAYYPDGAHTGVPELEVPTPDECSEPEYACNPEATQAPLYCVAGVCETLDDWNNPDSTGSGLDAYEPRFFLPIDQWDEAGPFSVKLTIPVDSLTEIFYYFCHIHSGMSAQIQVVDPSPDANELVPGPLTSFDPETYYPPIDEFDMECGTSAISEYHTDQDTLCPNQEFMCFGDPTTFNVCFEATNCKMNHDMRLEANDNNIATFMTQMIAHHEQAVSQSRVTLKHAMGDVGADDEDTDLEGLLYSIINVQNQQIQVMQAWLETYAPDADTTGSSSCPTS